MSIHVFTGTPGSGKSLHAASLVRYELTRKYPRPVIANFALGDGAPLSDAQRELYTYVPNEDMSAARIERMCQDYWLDSGRPFREDYITLVLDECQLLFHLLINPFF